MQKLYFLSVFLLVLGQVAGAESKIKVALGSLTVHTQVSTAWPQTERPLVRQDWARQELERRLKENMAQVEFVQAVSAARYFLITTVRLAEYCRVGDAATGRQAWLLEIGVRFLLWDMEEQREIMRETFRGYAVSDTLPSDASWESLVRNAFVRAIPQAAKLVEESLTGRVRTSLPKWKEVERQYLEQTLGKLPARYDKTPMIRSKTPVELFCTMAQEIEGSWAVAASTNQMLFRSGETVTAAVQSERTGFGYIVYMGASGNLTLLLPNRAMPVWRLNAGESYRFPDKGSGLSRLKVKLSEGQEKGQDLLYFVVTENPLTVWEDKLAQALDAGKNYPSLSLDDMRRVVEELHGKKCGTAHCLIEIVK
jgi:hypothetical protein